MQPTFESDLGIKNEWRWSSIVSLDMKCMALALLPKPTNVTHGSDNSTSNGKLIKNNCESLALLYEHELKGFNWCIRVFKG